MNFAEPTAVSILRLDRLTVVKTWTSYEVHRDPFMERWCAASAAVGEHTTVGAALFEHDEGIYWVRGHDDESIKALLVARALR